MNRGNEKCRIIVVVTVLFVGALFSSVADAKHIVLGVQIRGLSQETVQKNINTVRHIVMSAPYRDSLTIFDLEESGSVLFNVGPGKSENNAKYIRKSVDGVLHHLGTEYYSEKNMATPVLEENNNAPKDRFNVIMALEIARQLFIPDGENILILFSNMRFKSDSTGVDFRDGYPSDAHLNAEESDFTHFVAPYKIGKRFNAKTFIFTDDSYQANRLYLNRMARFYHYLFASIGGTLVFFGEPVWTPNSGDITQLLATTSPDKDYSLGEPLYEDGLLQIVHTSGFTYTHSSIKVDWDEEGGDIDLVVKFKNGTVLDYLQQTAEESLWINDVSMRHSRNTKLRTEQVVGFFSLSDIEWVRLHYVSGTNACCKGIIRYYEGIQEKANKAFHFEGTGGGQQERYSPASPNWKTIDFKS